MQDQVETKSPNLAAKSSWQELVAVIFMTAYFAGGELLPFESIWRWAWALVIGVIWVSIPAIQAVFDKRPIPWRKTIRNVLLVPVMMAVGAGIILVIISDWFQALISRLPQMPEGVMLDISMVVIVVVAIGCFIHMMIAEEIGKQLRNPLNLAFIAAALILLTGLFFIARAIV
jgi:uncharacterized protein YacL